MMLGQVRWGYDDVLIDALANFMYYNMMYSMDGLIYDIIYNALSRRR